MGGDFVKNMGGIGVAVEAGQYGVATVARARAGKAVAEVDKPKTAVKDFIGIGNVKASHNIGNFWTNIDYTASLAMFRSVDNAMLLKYYKSQLYDIPASCRLTTMNRLIEKSIHSEYFPRMGENKWAVMKRARLMEEIVW